MLLKFFLVTSLVVLGTPTLWAQLAPSLASVSVYAVSSTGHPNWEYPRGSLVTPDDHRGPELVVVTLDDGYSATNSQRATFLGFTSIARLRAQFETARISPEKRSVLLERDAPEIGLRAGTQEVIFVHDSDPMSVFYDTKTRSFGCAWGPELPTMRYVDFGFRSQDVLEMLFA